MTLHSLIHKTEETWWWYYAIPTRRKGRLHLLRVPAHTVETLVPPDNIYLNRDQWLRARQNWKLIVPGSVNADHARRFCTGIERQQEAGGYTVGPDITEEDRSVCHTCLRFALTNRHLIGWDQRPRLYNIVTPRYYLAGTNAIEAWQTRIRRELYNEHD